MTLGHLEPITWFFIFLSVAFLIVELAAIIYLPLGLIGIMGTWISLMVAVIIELSIITWRYYHD